MMGQLQAPDSQRATGYRSAIRDHLPQRVAGQREVVGRVSDHVATDQPRFSRTMSCIAASRS